MNTKTNCKHAAADKNVLLTLPTKDDINCITCNNWSHYSEKCLRLGIDDKTVVPSKFYCVCWEERREVEL